MGNFFFQVFLRLFAKRVAAAVGRGVFNHKLSPEELAPHAKALQEKGRLDQVVVAMLGARPLRFQKDGAAAAVQSTFGALLGREAEPTAVEAYSALLMDTQNLSEVLKDVAKSQEHWEYLLRQRAEPLVNAVFQALLQRDADPQALASYSALLRENRDIGVLIQDVGNSREHRVKLLRRGLQK